MSLNKMSLCLNNLYEKYKDQPEVLAKMEEYKNPEFKVKVCFKIGCDDPKCRSTNRESNSLCSEC